MKKIGHWISGELVQKHAQKVSPIFNPAIGEVIGECEHASAELIDEVVNKAHDAFLVWSQQPPTKRVQILFEFRSLMNQHQDSIVRLISQEHGKTYQDALGEIKRGLEVVDFACGIPHLLKGEYLNQVGSHVDSYSMRQPLGVCLGVTPFNFPAMVPMWMFPIALACGNAFILKPSEKVPSAALFMAKLLNQAGLPKDVFQVLQGGKETVESLIAHDKIACVSFVGSTPAAKAVHQLAIQYGKRVQALGGAKNHAVVMPDADLNQAVDGIMGAAFGSAGQRCMALSVVVAVGDKLAEQLIQRLIKKMRILKVGPATQVTAEMGPVHDDRHLSKMIQSIETAEKEGADIIYDGRSHDLPSGPGFFIGPTLLDHLKVSMKAYQEEIFGPVLGMIRVKSYDEAVQLINQHSFGNGTALFTRDGQTARDFTQRIQVGMVGINVPIPVPVSCFSFGGWKQSLFGDLHIYGPEGVHFYSRYKVVTSRWPKDEKTNPDYQMPVLS